MQDNLYRRDSFVFYRSFAAALQLCDPETQLLLFWAITNYALENTAPDFADNNTARIAWTLIEPQLRANNGRYTNGKKGGAPIGNNNAKKASEESESLPEIFTLTQQQRTNEKKTTQKQPNVNVNVNVNENENENYSLSLTPSHDAVSESESGADDTATAEREIFENFFFWQNVPDPRKAANEFLNYYTANGWRRANGAKITNKTAAAAQWETHQNGKHYPSAFFEFWRETCLAVPEVNDLSREVTAVTISDHEITITTTDAVRQAIETHLTQIRPIYTKHLNGKQLKYIIKPKTRETP